MRSEPRPLNDDEHRVLELILGASFEGVEPLRAQAVDVRVEGGCTCGCPSIELAVGASPPRSRSTEALVPVELNVAPLAEEAPAQVILFVRDGELSCLELVFYEDSPPTVWPTSDRLSLVSTGG